MRLANNRREGYALAVAIMGIVVIGALIAGSFYASNQEYRIGRNMLHQARAMGAAEHGHAQVLVSWDTLRPQIAALNRGDTLAWRFLSGDGSLDSVRLTRLTEFGYLVVSEGRSGVGADGRTRHRTGTFIRLAIPEINIRGALTTRGATRVGGSSQINGNDTSYAGWNCPPAGAAKPGVAIADPAQLTAQGSCSDLSCIQGDPKVLADPVAGDTSTYFQFGDANWASLTAMATKIYPSSTTLTGIGPVLSGGLCDRSALPNWGEPNRAMPASPCESYFPIIHARGNLHITGGRGQGVLLVDGDLQVDGGFVFYGPVIVRGTLRTQGTGGHFNGGVMAANVDLEQNVVLGNAVVRFSECAVMKALAGSSAPMFARGRGWSEMY